MSFTSYDIERIQQRLNELYDRIQNLVLNYVFCTDEDENLEEYETYLFKCHTTITELEILHSYDIIEYKKYVCLRDVIMELINRHIGQSEYISKFGYNNLEFDI